MIWHENIKTTEPNPALKNLARLIGTWMVSGEANGQVTFSWIEGGYFIVQYVDLIGTKGIEFIGFDEERGTLRSHYFDSLGKIFEFTYDVNETGYVVSINMPDVKGRFKARISEDGSIIAGNWQCKKDGEDFKCEAILNRINNY